jgi:hypothetical protein
VTTGASKLILPSSTRSPAPKLVNALDIEAIGKIVSPVIGAPDGTSRTP